MRSKLQAGMTRKLKSVGAGSDAAAKTDAPVMADVFDARTIELLRGFFDAQWYLERYPELRSIDLDPLMHFSLFGAAEGRDPNRFFDSAWYAIRYPDVEGSGYPPLVHYLTWGVSETRNPHPRFDAAYYTEMHPEAAANPLLHHIRVGAARGWPTEKPIDIDDYLPSTALPPSCPDGVQVDVVIAVYRGLRETQQCLNSVLEDHDRPPGAVIVVEDCSPEPKLVAWLRTLARSGRITLLHNARNLGFAGSVNRGMTAAGTHDVALLNADTVVPDGWLPRLAAQAYAVPRVASISPFSNNATICGYPSVAGVSAAFGLDVHAIDAACQAVNVGRSVEVPTTVGFCMYIRRAALNDVGLFDVETFGQGYGEENDFCLRASARGWRHMLACDTYVFHEGNVSFGAAAVQGKARARTALLARYPDYEHVVARHVWLDAAGGARFAATAALLRASGKPCVLMVSHDFGGGVERHISELAARLGDTANVLLLGSSARGVSLSVPALPGHSMLSLTGDRLDELASFLRTVNLHRVHVHHVAGLDLDLGALLRRLDVGYDVTVHDYYAICPQVNLLPSPGHRYCGEPGPAACNACIARRPSYGAREILSWRRSHARLLVGAERVLCPSEDVRARLARHGLARNAVLAAHEAVHETAWNVRAPPAVAGRPLRIAVLGVLAGHKGEISVVTLAEAAPAEEISLHLIGRAERELPAGLAARMSVTGEYQEAELPGLLARVKPHVVWFAAQWPETYSYTLSAAIDAGLPIVATRIGAFPERLAGRPLTWLVEPTASTEEWRAIFRAVRVALGQPASRGVARTGSAVASRGASPGATTTAGRRTVADFYARDYAAPLRAPAVRRHEIDLRQSGRISVVAVPERLANGALSPCAYIRLLQPLDHPAIARGIPTTVNIGLAGANKAGAAEGMNVGIDKGIHVPIDMLVAEPHEVSRLRADLVATQRYAIPDIATADALAARCRETGARLLYDLDDDLLHIPRDHPEASVLRPRAPVVARMLRHADAVWVSTPGLAEALRATRPAVRVVANGLDERLWDARPGDRGEVVYPVRLLFMGSATHFGDWQVVAGAMERVVALFGAGVAFDMIGVVGAVTLPSWVSRISPSRSGMASYPGFVNWITRQPAWDIGIAPLADTAFNASKSAIKMFDYAALGLAVLASDVPAYRGSFCDGPRTDGDGVDGGGGRLVANTEAAWFRALCDLINDAALRRRLADGARGAFVAHHTLAAQATWRRAAWLELAGAAPVATPGPAGSPRRRQVRAVAE
jgi:GT2 family glycosyltransferase/glycosyltransferase involved in cell wall biosynthesis